MTGHFQRQNYAARLRAAGLSQGLTSSHCQVCLEDMLLGAVALTGHDDFEFLATALGPCLVARARVGSTILLPSGIATVRVRYRPEKSPSFLLHEAQFESRLGWIWDCARNGDIKVLPGDQVELLVNRPGFQGVIECGQQ